MRKFTHLGCMHSSSPSIYLTISFLHSYHSVLPSIITEGTRVVSKPSQSPLIPLDIVDAFTQIINTLAKSRQYAHWYVKRAEEYLRVVALRPLSLHGKDVVEAYLTDLGRRPGLSSWQFRQCVEAIGVLLKVAQAPALCEVDWHFWLNGAKDLGDRHATVGRERYTVSLTPYSGSTSPRLLPSKLASLIRSSQHCAVRVSPTKKSKAIEIGFHGFSATANSVGVPRN